MRRFFPTVLLLLIAGVPSVWAQPSQVLANNCAGTQTASTNDQWIQGILKAFGPKPGAAPSLRVVQWEDPTAQEIIQAKNGIVQTCAGYLAGSTTRDAAEPALAGFERTYMEFIKNAGSELDVAADAAGGQVSQIATISSQLTGVATVARQASLFGLTNVGEAGHQAMRTALVNFSQPFKTACFAQTFDPQIAIEIAAQNATENTGIDVMPCASRKFTSFVSNTLFESCTPNGVGAWRVTWEFGLDAQPQESTAFALDANRQTASGNYSVTWDAGNGVAYRNSGRATLSVTEAKDAEGKSARAYRLKGKYSVDLTKGAEKIAMLQKLMGGKVGGKGPFDMPVTVSGKPCKSVDDDPQ